MMIKTLFKSSLIAASLASCFANADTLAITNASIHTATNQGVLENATLVITDGKITAINPDSVSADVTFDAEGKTLTPGFIGSMNQVGLVEVSAVAETRDAGDKKADITFDPSYAFNPKSTVVRFSRVGGITSNVSTPWGGDDMFKGLAFAADLSGDFDSVRSTGNAVLIELDAQSKGSRATNYNALVKKLQGAKKQLDKAQEAKESDEKAEYKDDEKIVHQLLNAEIPLIAHAERASDVLQLLELKQTFGIDLVLAFSDDAVAVADQIAKAEVPVILAALSNLPGNFDSLHANLENAGKLSAAGVKVVLTVKGDTHNLHQLRFDAGVAVANGMEPSAALASVTSNVADVFNLDTGSIEVGKRADIVLWSADPFELSSKVEKMWIDGEETSLKTRQDKLRDRYVTESAMPKAYTK